MSIELPSLPVFFVLPLMISCSEYDLTPEPDLPRSPETETTTVETEPPICDDRLFPPDLLNVDESCLVVPQPGSFTPVVEWSRDSFAVEPSSNNVMMTPIVVSLTDDTGDGFIDGNDIPDVVFLTYVGSVYWAGGTLRAVSGDDGSDLWTAALGELDGSSGLAAADLDGDGMVEIVVLTDDSRIRAFQHDGTPWWTSDPYAAHMGGAASMPAISDMDADGSPEIVVGAVILNSDGSLRGLGAHGIGCGNAWAGSTSFAVDIDGDGVQEVVTGNALYRPDGSAIWHNGEADGFVAVGNFDADDRGEIAVVGEGVIRLQDDNGTVLWSSPMPGGGAYGGPPTIADLDGDGEPEIGVAGISTYAAFDGDGTLLWSNVTDDSSSGVTGSAVFDFEGDGVADVVYADEGTLWAYAGDSGSTKLASPAHSSWTVSEYPVIVDVDGDGEAEIVMANSNHPSRGDQNQAGISVVGDANHSWRSGRKIWNQAAYHITNIDDDGRVPIVADRNWLTFNSFRSGDMTPELGYGLPDLVSVLSSLCAEECDRDRLWVWVQAGNVGTASIAADVDIGVWLEIDGDWVRAASTTIAGGIASGELLGSVQFVIEDPRVREATRLMVDIDDPDGSGPGAIDECDELNNAASIEWPACP